MRSASERPGARDPRAVLEELLAEEQGVVGREVLAPCLGGGKVRVRHRGLVYECLMEGGRPGWGVFRVSRWRRGALRATWSREAEVWERESYAARLPRKPLVLAHRDERGQWWAADFRDAALPVVPVHLVEGVQVFDGILACQDGVRWWFTGPDPSWDPRKADFLRRAREEDVEPAGIELKPRDEQVLQAVRATRPQGAPLERRLRSALAMGQGTLVDYTEVNGGYNVLWTKGVRRLTTVVDSNLSVISAGLCLSGGDRDHDLSSLASLVPPDDPWAGYPGY